MTALDDKAVLAEDPKPADLIQTGDCVLVAGRWFLVVEVDREFGLRLWLRGGAFLTAESDSKVVWARTVAELEGESAEQAAADAETVQSIELLTVRVMHLAGNPLYDAEALRTVCGRPLAEPGVLAAYHPDEVDCRECRAWLLTDALLGETAGGGRDGQ
jgi:hypothetical protein